MERPVRILLVEDNEVYRSSLELLLGLQAGLAVVGAVGDGAAALAACRDLAPDVVLMDYRLPGMDGAQATEALRAACPGAAVVCLTAEATPEQGEAVRSAGAVALVGKSEPVVRLADVVRAAAGRAA